MIDSERLRRSVEHAWKTPFPDHPDSEELDDLMMELDGYIVGLADSTTRGAPPPRQINDFPTSKPSSPPSNLPRRATHASFSNADRALLSSATW
jgi:hypothetical protein